MYMTQLQKPNSKSKAFKAKKNNFQTGNISQTKCIQREAGDLCCMATVTYENGETNSAVGYNDSGTAQNTVNTFNNYHLTRLCTLKQVSNQPGACAEPHAVAAALKKADEPKGKGKGKTKSKKGSGNKGGTRVKEITVGPALFTKSCKNRIAAHVRYQRKLTPVDESFGTSLLGRCPRPKNDVDADAIKGAAHNISHPPCATCAQWISNGRVLPEYLE